MTEIERVKKLASTTKELGRAANEMKFREKMLKNDINNKRDTTTNRIILESNAKKVESLKKELDRLK